MVFVPLRADTQETQWKKHMDAALEAHRQGHYGDAEKLMEAALKEAERFGPEDLRLGTTLNNLAELYRDQGKYAEAEPLYKRSLVIVVKVLGPEHPYSATSLNSLGQLYHQQGKYGAAESLYKRSRVIIEKALGPEHPTVATSLENYAMLLRKTNRDAEAARLEGRAKAIRAKHAQKNLEK